MQSLQTRGVWVSEVELFWAKGMMVELEKQVHLQKVVGAGHDSN